MNRRQTNLNRGWLLTRRPLTCHHEAGHALVRWYFGHPTDDATVLTPAEVRAGKCLRDSRGRIWECEGRVDGYSIAPPIAAYYTARPDEPPDFPLQRKVNVEVSLIESAAGPVAEARYAKRGLGVCLLAGGDGDMKAINKLLDAARPNDPAAHREAKNTAYARAGALIRSEPGWRAITLMADALQAKGRVTGAEIEKLCGRAYGASQPSFEAHLAAWPPTLKMLRSGALPPGQ